MNDLLYAFSYALDCVEHDLLGVTTYHGPRVAAMSVAMGKQLGFSEGALLDLAGCAILHDNALTEYIQEERSRGVDILDGSKAPDPSSHCIAGEKNIEAFPFETDVSGHVLYHHENADGTGAFGKKAENTPLCAQLIHIADEMDLSWDFSFFPAEKYRAVAEYGEKHAGKLFSRQCVQLFERSCTPEFLSQLNRERAIVVIREMLPTVYRDYSQEQVIGFCSVMARIIDYKSKFTRKHSLGIARKAKEMGEYYKFDEDTVTKLYFAGALHDVGKLVVDSNILEKPSKLTEKEYRHIQNHAYKSYEILKQIEGLGEVVDWAALHHEKLDGRGYPFGKTGEQLGQKERLMACLDIYQALTEERPYKKGLEHSKAMDILRSMAFEGQLDSGIVEDIGRVYASS